MIGRVLGNRYKLIAELGSGGMAWVYLAEDLVEGERVAVKILYPQHSQDLGFLQRFIREARLSMALTQSSPQKNVVKLLDYGADRDTHYLVMEYVSGRDLGQILAKQGVLPWQTALDLARQVAVALDHAHRHEIVHRDIKPSNIMVMGDGAVRVLDFGIARARTSPDLTLSGFVGSPNYAAPEQATGQPVDIRADIYSLGIVLYRMLGGELPFQGSTPWEVVNQHIATPAEPLEKKRPSLPRRVVRLVERAMAKRPEDRFQSPAEMVKAIDTVLAGQDLPEPTPMPGPAARDAALESLYASALAAMAAEHWHEAVDILSRILKLEPDYRDVSELLGEVGHQIRLASHYRSIQRALERSQWDRALEQVAKLEALAPGYKDVAELRGRAERHEPLPAKGAASGGEFPTQIEEAGLTAPGGIRSPGGLTAPGGTSPPEPPSPGEGSTAAPDGAEHDNRRRLLLWIGIPLLLLIVAAAGLVLSGAVPLAAPTPTPTITASPTATATITPSATATATATPSPTDTATATPSPTATPRPSASPTTSPSPTDTATATATATATRRVVVTPAPAGQIAFPRYDSARRTYDVYVCSFDRSGGIDDGTCRRVVAQASQPDFLPGGDQLVVHSWQPDNKGLAVYDVSGRLVWRITGQIEAARPSVDFQGENYVYHSRQEADRQARLYRSYGAEMRPLSREASVIRGVAPSWTPDGQILYSGCLGDACGIILMRSNGANPRQVIAGGTETNPEASPDGQQVAFMSQRDGNWEVYVAGIDGSNMQRITRNPGNDGLPAWSPDGRYLAFISDRDGGWAVWLVRADGSGLKRLFPIGGPLDGPVQGAALYEVHGWVEERISWGPLP